MYPFYGARSLENTTDDGQRNIPFTPLSSDLHQPSNNTNYNKCFCLYIRSSLIVFTVFQ